MKTIYFVTGASGVGKTTLIDTLAKKYQNKAWVFAHFDSIGIPSTAEMTKQFGSPAQWQRAKTFAWINKLVNGHGEKKIFFEGQVDPQFITQGFAACQFDNYRIVLIDCDEDDMQLRLTNERLQPELFTENMKHWRRYLRKAAEESSIPILDTSNLSPEEAATAFEEIIGL